VSSTIRRSPVKTLAKLYGDQYAAAGEAAEAWKAGHEQAEAVGEVEEIVDDCLALHPRVVRMVKHAWERAFAGKVTRPEGEGTAILGALRRVGWAWDVLDGVVRECTDRGYDVPAAGRVRETREEVRRLTADFASRWPFARPDVIERSRKEIEEGRFVTGEELLRELDREAGAVD
jgi:hypothetical protein